MELLREGSSGGDVTALQSKLQAAGFPPGAIDGNFGPGTLAAVLAFQQSEGLIPDGVVGPDTARALGFADAELPPPAAMPNVTVAIVAKMFPVTPLGHINANLPQVLAALVAADLTQTPIVLAALATIRAETEGFVPISEGRSRFNTSPDGHPFDLYDNRKDLGNQGPPDGDSFKGRGYVQLTGRANYAKFGPLVGVDNLVDQPDQANDPVIAAKILAAFLNAKKAALGAARGQRPHHRPPFGERRQQRPRPFRLGLSNRCGFAVAGRLTVASVRPSASGRAMNRSQFCRPLAIAALRFLCLAALAMLASGPMAGIARAAAEETDVIERVSAIDDGDKLSDGPIGLNDGVALILKGPTVPVPAEAVLYLNTHKMTGLTDVRYLPQLRALVFRLSRDASNAEAWKPVLASPSFRPFAVAVTLTKAGASGPLVVGADGKPPTIKFLLIPFPWLAASGVAVLLVIAALWAAASKTNLLKDSLLPQLSPKEQPFSLGRSQMAFWFALIFATYVFLFVALGDYNTLTNQSLALMGISGATAIFAVAVDASKDTPIGAVNETLRALGLATYGDVVRLDQEIAQRQAALVATPSLDPATILRLQTEITDRLNKKRLYHDKTRPFISDGWYRDVTTDINGPALHRLQMFVWTLTLGAVFVIEVYQTLAMPEFSATLLALMGVTSAGYIGFKYPERQN